jgi:isoleucyl-tRNA synthetase
MLPNYNALEIESEILKFWEENKIYPKSKKKNKGNEKFYFLQGPPYTSGRLHMGHAWNSGMKDMVLRYKRMRGFDVWDRGGYDMHGLPTELKVQALHNLNQKEDIEKFGLKKFADECMKFSTENADIMSKDLWRMGVWMDNENAYMPVKNEFMEGQWWLIKKAHENGRLYKGFRTLSWCASCETALAKHEQEYKSITENSIFLKFRRKNSQNEYFIVWTTTPWTIAFNMAIMVNPNLKYVKCKVGNEFWIMAKQLAAPIIANFTESGYEAVEEFFGDTLDKAEYVHPWEDIIPEFKELKENYPRTHTIILSKEYVDTTAGSGLVHSAPGCGPEDFEVGRKYNIPPFNNLSEQGIFPESMGKFAGLAAKKDDKKFIEALAESGALIAETPVDHDYAHCWRCKQPVIFRATEQWFLKIEDLKDSMVAANQEVNWIPNESKESYNLWTRNLRDNSITKQRFWGTPAPIWVNVDDDGDYIVIGSAEELKKLAGKIPKNLHKPWIDDIIIEKDGKTYRRIPDVLDVWLDAGTVSWNCLDYPQRTDLFERYYPADFILEAKEQVRLWFSMLNICSFVTMGTQSYRNVYCTGMITDIEGVKMSKSLGNIISPYEIIDKYGTDTMRYYLSRVNAGDNIKFSWDEVALKSKNLIILWNIHKFLIDLCSQAEINPAKLKKARFEGFEEKYILSRMNSTIKKVTELYDAYRLDETVRLIEELYLDLSRNYIQLIRDKAAVGDESEKEEVAYCIYHTLLNTVKMFSTICPFIADRIFLNFKEQFKLKEASIHLSDWPSFDESKIDTKIEEDIQIAGNVMQAISSAREKSHLSQRWPLREAVITAKDEKTASAVVNLKELIERQMNIKKIKVEANFANVKEIVKADFSKLGPLFGAKTAKIIAHLATQSPEKIIKHIEKDGKYMVKIDNENLEILKDHLIVVREVPKPWVEAEFRAGNVYLNSEMDKELESEGYAREAMRRVQELRKKAGLQKSDKINLFIKSNAEMASMLKQWDAQIKQKCGADNLEIADSEPAAKYSHTSSDKIKNFEFDFRLEKI